MEKKINKYIKDVIICENCLSKLNENIEKYYVNSQVLLVVDFFTYQKYFNELELLKKNSLNNIVIKVYYNEKKCSEKINEILDETFSLIVAVGDFCVINFVKEYTIKNTINFAICNLYNLKCEIFTQKCKNSDKNIRLNAVFVLINKYSLTKKEIFLLYLNIWKYNFLLFDCDNNEIKINYLKILASITSNNLFEKVVAMGLILNKAQKEFIIKKSFDDFKNFIYLQCYFIILKNIISGINGNNLSKKIMCYSNDFNELKSYNNFDYNYNKFFLLTKKDIFLYSIENLLKLNKNMLNELKINFFDELYLSRNNHCKISLCEIDKHQFNDDFLNKMKYFELFDKTYKIFA